MALVKQPIDIPFNGGVDTKTDSKRVAMGKFLQLQNTVCFLIRFKLRIKG